MPATNKPRTGDAPQNLTRELDELTTYWRNKVRHARDIEEPELVEEYGRRLEICQAVRNDEAEFGSYWDEIDEEEQGAWIEALDVLRGE